MSVNKPSKEVIELTRKTLERADELFDWICDETPGLRDTGSDSARLMALTMAILEGSQPSDARTDRVEHANGVVDEPPTTVADVDVIPTVPLKVAKDVDTFLVCDKCNSLYDANYGQCPVCHRTER